MTRMSLAASLATVLALTSGCDQQGAVAPFGEVSEPFAVYGVLDADAEVQRLRVEVRRRSVDLPTTPQEAFLANTTVTSGIRLIDGTLRDVREWRQRAERLPDGTYASVFEAAFRPEPLSRHEVRVLRSDSDAAPDAELVQQVVVPSASYVQQEEVELDGDRVRVPLSWSPMQVDSIAVTHIGCTYRLSYEQDSTGTPRPVTTTQRYELAGFIDRSEAEAGRIVVELSDLIEPVRAISNLDSADVHYLQLRYTARVLDAGWGSQSEDDVSGYLAGVDTEEGTLVFTAELRRAAGFSVPPIAVDCPE